MGCMATDAGISIQHYTVGGEPHGLPIYGRHAKLFGIRRDKKDGTADQGLLAVELGSAEWLTIVAIADSVHKLEAILKEPDVVETSFGLQPCESSGSSRHVQIELHIGDHRQTLRDRITIASGPIVQPDPGDVNASVPRVHVVNIKVFPADFDVNQTDIFGEWKGMGLFLQNLLT